MAVPRASLVRLVPVLIVIVALSSVAFAQDQPAEEADAGTLEPGADAPLNAGELGAEAQQVITSLRRLQAQLHHVAQVEHHVAVIVSLGREVERLKLDSDLDTLDTQPRRELHNLDELWKELDARLAHAGEALEESSGRLETEAESLRAIRRRWDRTRSAAVTAGYPVAARAQIDEVLEALDEVETDLREHLERVLAAQTRLSAHGITSGDVLTQLEHALEESRARLGSRTHPVGLGGVEGRTHESLGAQLQAAFMHQVHSLDRFATHVGTRIYLHAFLVLLLLVWLYWLRREQRVEDAESHAARSVGHPIALTAIVGLLLVRPLYPLAPRTVVELSQVLAVVPLLFIRTAPRARRTTTLVVVLYLLEWIRLLLDEHDTEHRVVLLLTAAGASVGFAWRALRAAGRARPAWGAASLTAAVGLGACIAGYVPLSVLLVEGVIASAFVAVVLVALHWAFLGLVDAGLTTRFAQGTVLGRHASITRKAMTRASKLIFAFGFLWVALDYFRLQAVVAEQAERALAESVSLGEIEISLGEVLAFALGIWAAVVLSRVLSAALEEDLAPRLQLGPGVPAAAALIVRYTVLALGFLLAAAAAGIGLSQLALFAGALGVGVGFGLQNVVSNFVSGLLLVFERPVKVGDTVDIAGFRGTIIAIGIRASTVRAWTGADVIIPNSKLIESELVNWTHSDPWIRVDFAVGVAYGSDLRRVHQVLLETAQALPAGRAEPPPVVLMTGFGDSSIDFEIRLWITNPPDLPKARSALALAVNDALAAANIEIPFPQRDLHIRSDATKG